MATVIDNIITVYSLEDKYSAKLAAIMAKSKGGMGGMMGAGMAGMASAAGFDIAGNVMQEAGAKVTSFGKDSIMAAGQMQMQMKSLEALTHSAKEAQSQFAFMDQEAKHSRFQLVDLVEAGKRLDAYGMDITRFLPLADDLSAAMNVSLKDAAFAMEQIHSGSFGRGFYRLRQLGITKVDLEGQGLHFSSANKYVEQDVNKAMDAVEAVIKKKFGGLSEKIGVSTLPGALSMLADEWNRLERTVGGGSGLERATAAIVWLTHELESLRTHLGPTLSLMVLMAGPLITLGGVLFHAATMWRIFATMGTIAKIGLGGTQAGLLANTTTIGANALAIAGATTKWGMFLGVLRSVGTTLLAVGAIQIGGNILKEQLGVQQHSNEDFWGSSAIRGAQGLAIGAKFGGPIGGLIGGALGFAEGMTEETVMMLRRKTQEVVKGKELDKKLADWNSKSKAQKLEAIRAEHGGRTPHENQRMGLDPATGKTPTEIAAATGAGMAGGLESDPEAKKILDQMDKGLAKDKADTDALLKAELGDADKLSKIAGNTREIADRTKGADFKKMAFGGSELGRLGVTAAEFAAARKGGFKSATASSDTVKVHVTGANKLESMLTDIVTQAVVGLKRQGALQ